MNDAGGERRAPVASRARSQIRRGSELAEERVARGIGEPALFAIMLSAAVSAIFFTLGVVAGDALGLTPVVYLFAGLFLLVTIATYVEGSSLHIERGGASSFARYAFDEFWSFIAGWAILLDYLIVMAAAAVALTHYLGVFWGELDDGWVEIAIAGVALAYVAAQNVRGLTDARLGMVLRVSLLSIALLLVVAGIAFAQFFDAARDRRLRRARDDADVGGRDLRRVVASVALMGVEAASGLAGEVRVGRRGLRRVVIATAGVALVLFVAVSAAA